jgi:CheY-like chemotaxis protein
MLVRIPYDPGHARQCRQLFGRALRIAARNKYPAIGIYTLQSPYRCACILIRAFRNCASVQYDNFSVASRPGAIHSPLQKLPLQRRPVGLGSATAKILYVEAGHASILNERCLRLNLVGAAPRSRNGAGNLNTNVSSANPVERPASEPPRQVPMKRRILLVDDDLAVLLTLKAVLELHGFEVETASSSAEAVMRMESSEFQMVISDLNMETEEAGLEVIRTARRQAYDPATALLTAFPPSGEKWNGKPREAEKNCDSLLIKPLGTSDLLRQVEALLVQQADKQLRRRDSSAEA